MLDILFKFPIVIIDGETERKKGMLDLPTGSEDPDIAVGEAEYPYFDLIGLADMWMPTKESMDKAMDGGGFDACLVTFANVGNFLVPMTKDKFKAKFQKFMDGIKPKEETKVLKISKEDLKNILDKMPDDEE